MNARDRELAVRCEATEAEASFAVHLAPAPNARVLGLGARRLGAAVAVCCPLLDVMMYNRVIALGSGVPAREADLDEALDWFGEAGAARFMVQLIPGAAPGELADWLLARGFYRHNYWQRLALELDAGPRQPARESPHAVRAIGPREAAAFADLVAEAFHHPPELPAWIAATVGLPGWKQFGIFDGATLASAAALFARGDEAWIGFAATRERYRGRGMQTALLRHRIDAARAAGARRVAVETAADTPEKPNPSTHNLRRVGFRDLYERDNWVKVLKAPVAR